MQPWLWRPAASCLILGQSWNPSTLLGIRTRFSPALVHHLLLLLCCDLAVLTEDSTLPCLCWPLTPAALPLVTGVFIS